uniref:START domain-containing protein n=1 Tax=Panagrolaimus superbus TaxID=310955 RepID=A0A914Y7E4_9BILA
MGTPAPIDKTATLTEAEYCELADKAADDVIALFEDKQNWTSTNYGDETFAIYTRKSDVKDAKESMLMLECELDLSPEKLEILLAPWGKYRLQWDDMLEDATTITSFGNDVYLLRHIVKKRISLSSRESIDIVKVVRTPERIIFASCGTSHNEYPPSKAHVRTHQYVGGYIIERLPNLRSKFTIIFHADLNLPGPKLISSLADRFKPRLVIENVKGLKEGIERFRTEL